MSEQENVQTAIQHISIKPPPFYLRSPETWFIQLESQFTLAGIKSETTKYHHALAALPENVASDLTLTENTDYTELKNNVLQNLKANKHVLIDQALSDVELNDKRPSILVNELQKRFKEIGLTPDDELIKSRLLKALPPSVRSALVGHDSQPLQQYSQIADSMMAVSQLNQTMSVATIQKDNTTRNQQKSFPVHPFYDGQRPRICNSHIFYANRARNCRRWCQWPNKNAKIIPENQKTPHHSRSSSPTNL